jgi:Rrf2 family protein
LSHFSRKDLLAIAIVVDIAMHAQRGRLVIGLEVGRRHRVSKRHAEPLLQALTSKGILAGKRGPKGGYSLARDPTLISADDVIRVVRGAEEGGVGGQVQSTIASRVVRPALRQAERAVSEALQGITIQQLVRSAGRP